ncbi:MAG: helix-turn-helix transcriptional regulator [Candidatus Azobacteroides sp.]|nr:helix-turn-helix transcriptional regulator [Candidatus Azobacteroides sp.]
MNYRIVEGQQCGYDKALCQKDETLFQSFKNKKGEQVTFEIKEVSIIFLLEGEVSLSYDMYSGEILHAKHFLLVPPATCFNVTVLKNAHFFLGVFDLQTKCCENFSLDVLLPFLDRRQKDVFYPLPFKEPIRNYLEVMDNYLHDGIFCDCLNENKREEFFFLLQAYYRKEELAAFFYPVLNEDVLFKEKVLKNMLAAHNVSELATLMNYSVSGFKKKFERNFGQSVYLWMQDRRSKIILRELKENKKSIKEIAFQYQFSSQPRFYEFCKRHYGKTPGEIRTESAYSLEKEHL